MVKHVAAYLLAQLGGKDKPSTSDITSILDAVGAAPDADNLKKLMSGLEGKDITDVLVAGRSKMAVLGGGGGGGGGGEGDDDDDEEEYYESYAGDGDPQGMAERYQEAEDIFNEWEEDDRQREAEAKALGITMAELDAKEILEDIGDHWKAWENPNKLTPKQKLVKNLQNETWVAEYKLELKEKETAKWAELDELVEAKAASLGEGEKVQWADLEFDNNYV